MKADLNIPVVTGVEIAAVIDGGDDNLWDIIIINRTNHTLENVIITSKGYGESNGRKQQTSILRHLIENLPSDSYARIEPIQANVFHLTNEYWVSFYKNKELYDKKYIFLPHSIQENNAKEIPGFDFMGVTHK